MTDQLKPASPKASSSARISAVLAAVVILYPAIVYFGFRYTGPRLLAAGLIGLFAVRLVLLGRGEKANQFSKNIRIMAGIGIALSVLSFFYDSPNAMLYYPVVVNALLLSLFVHSLIRPPPIIERFARMREKNLPQYAVDYTRKATIAWAVFFLLNGSISLYTVLASSMELWTLFNGLISYILVGCMFLGEFIIRSLVRRRNRK